MGKWSRVREIVSKPDYKIDPFRGTPPKGMVPSSVPGVYVTPEVIEPTDCDNYPDSVFCGGNPISRTPLDVGIEIKADRCGVSARFSPTIAYFKFPGHGVAYVKPECRNEPPPYQLPPPPSGLENRQEIQGFDRGIPDNEIVYAGITITSGESRFINCSYTENGIFYPLPNAKVWTAVFVNGQRLSYGYGDRTVFGDSQTLTISAYSEVTVKFTGYDSMRACGREQGEVYNETNEGTIRTNINPTSDLTTEIYTINTNGDLYSKGTLGSGTQFTYPEYNIPPMSSFRFMTPLSYPKISIIAYGTWGTIKKYYEKLYQNTIEANVGVEYVCVITCFDVLRPDEPPPPNYNQYPDNFNPNPRCNCMGCCSPSPYQQNKDKEQERKRDECCEEIKKLLKDIKNILGTGKPKIEYYDVDPNKVEAQKKTVTPQSITLALEEFSKLHSITQRAIGVEEFPVQYPDSIVEPVNDNILGQVWDFITPDKVRKITSLAQMLDWASDQQSATIGKLQRKIEQEVEDNRVQSDGTIKKGTKKVSVSIPDLATGIEEIFKMQIQLLKALGLNTDIGIKSLQESVNSSIMSAETVQRIKSIEGFLSFPTKQKSVDLPIQITIPTKESEKDVEKDLIKYLQTSKNKIVWDDFDGSQTLYEMMINILQASATIQAIYYGRS